MSDPGNGFGQQPGNGGPAGGDGDQWSGPGQQRFGAGGASGASGGNPYGLGPGSGSAQAHGPGAGGFGGPAGTSDVGTPEGFDVPSPTAHYPVGRAWRLGGLGMVLVALVLVVVASLS